MSELLTTKQVAARLQLSERHIKRLRANGTGPRAVKLGNRVRYRADDVDAWVDGQYRPEPARRGRPRRTA